MRNIQICFFRWW